MIELFFSLYKLVVFAALGRWYDDVNAGKISPFKVSLVWFLVSITLFLLMLRATVEISKICYIGFACHAMLISIMYLITNDHEDYCKNAGIWIGWMTGLLMITGFLTLAMDYPKTKDVLNPMLIGCAAATVPDMLKRKRRI